MADLGVKKVRKSNFSPEEVEALVTTVGRYYHILYGEFSKRAINNEARHKVWLDVTRRVNRVSVERRTLQEVKNKWKKCQHLYKEHDSAEDVDKKMKNKTKHRGNKNNKRIKIRQCTSYEPDFKKAVVLYAEQKSTSEAKRRYGISESNIRRWRRLKNDILEKASQAKTTRKSSRTANTYEGSLEECDSLDFSSSLDSMPLEQRLKTPPDQEPVLQSQPLSPTKLKVTRQSTKPIQPPPKPVSPEPPNEEVCLRWNSHHSNMQHSFPNLLLREQYVDATLVAEGQSLKCHRLILSSCSPYFEEVLSGISPFQHPVLFMKDIPFWILKSLCDFMYAGEVHIFQSRLEELLAVAESLKIKGLAGKMDGSSEEVKKEETPKVLKEEKKEEKEPKEKKRTSQHSDSTPKTTSRTVRSVHGTSKKSGKVSKESLSKQGILDPLDLLEPVYEEVTTESTPLKVNDIKNVSMKKGKLKKRKFSEEREESPPPLFLSRKGTRSRPNVKIPKYYHTHYERVSESTIVREPHTDQPDPLMQLEDIKAEPLDVEDDVIEIEDNVIGFPDVSELPPHEEEIIGNYDSPLVNLNEKASKEDQPTFNKISLVAQPIIVSIHSIADKSPSTVQIVDVAQLKGIAEALDKTEDPLATKCVAGSSKVTVDPLHLIPEAVEKGADSITITNVQTLAEEPEKDGDINTEHGDATKELGTETEKVPCLDSNCEFRIEKVVSEKEDLVEISGAVHEVAGSQNETATAEISNVDNVDRKESVQGEINSTGDVPKSEIANVTEKEGESAAETAQISIDGGVVGEKNVQDETNDSEDISKSEFHNVTKKEVESLAEKITADISTDDSVNLKEDVHGESSITEVPSSEVDENITEKDEATNIAKEKVDETAHAQSEEEKILNDTEEMDTNEEGPVELGFHIAKVASLGVDENITEKDDASNIGREKEGEVAHAQSEGEKILNDTEEMDTTDEGPVELGFHIAKVASEQFSVNEIVKMSEDCASDLGFHIMDVSGLVEDSDQKTAEIPNDASCSDAGRFTNHLPQTEREAVEKKDAATESNSVLPGTSDSVSEETRFLAESLEKLLDK